MALVTINENFLMGKRSLELLTQCANRIANEMGKYWVLVQFVMENLTLDSKNIIIEIYSDMYCFDVYFHGLTIFDRCSACSHSTKTFRGLDYDCNDCICFGSLYHQCDNCHCSHFWIIVASANVKVLCDDCENDV